MLSKRDLELIFKEVNNVNNTTEKKEGEYEVDIELLNLEESVCKDLDVTYIDSSYASGVIGPYAYIYSRAVSVSPYTIKEDRDFLLLSDTFFYAESYEGEKLEILDVSDISGIISKNLEYRLAVEADTEFVVIDGSLLSDAIFYSNGIEYKILEDKIMSRYEEFLINFKKIINTYTFSIAKRILGGKFICSNTNSENSDFMLLLSKYPEEEFYTQIFIQDMRPNITVINGGIKALYFRPRDGDHIYRLETFGNTPNEKILEFLCSTVKKQKRYPMELKLAHNRAKETSKEKYILEHYLKNSLGLSKTVDWETK